MWPTGWQKSLAMRRLIKVINRLLDKEVSCLPMMAGSRPGFGKVYYWWISLFCIGLYYIKDFTANFIFFNY